MVSREMRARILASYDRHGGDTVSTERLLMMVADDCGCEIEDVVEALVPQTE